MYKRQDLWIALQDYQNEDWNNLIQLWKFFNLHIIQVIKSVDQTKLDSYWCDYPWRSANNINQLGFAEKTVFSGDKRVYTRI